LQCSLTSAPSSLIFFFTMQLTPDGVVVLDFAALNDPATDYTAEIEAAFGPNGLGALFVQGVPELAPSRRELLAHANAYGHLPPNVRVATEHPDSQYCFGWSHGREIMNGKPDWAKGSYYNNPLRDHPDRHVQGSPYFQDNIWPAPGLIPGFREDFMSLGKLIVDVGALVARQCDRYVSSKLPEYPESYLERVVTCPETTKARLLHYFARDASATDDTESMDSWCGWHIDHSSLTGLTSAMFVSEKDPTSTSPTEIASPDPESGLYIRRRSGDVIKIKIPRDCLAFQTGEALEVVSQGFVVATPHCVRGCKDVGVARNTYAVFMQPPAQAPLKAGMTFEQFTEQVLKRHYVF